MVGVLRAAFVVRTHDLLRDGACALGRRARRGAGWWSVSSTLLATLNASCRSGTLRGLRRVTQEGCRHGPACQRLSSWAMHASSICPLCPAVADGGDGDGGGGAAVGRPADAAPAPLRTSGTLCHTAYAYTGSPAPPEDPASGAQPAVGLCCEGVRRRDPHANCCHCANGRASRKLLRRGSRRLLCCRVWREGGAAAPAPLWDFELVLAGLPGA